MEQKYINTFKILENYGNDSTREMKQQRGRDFEVLIADVLEAEAATMLRRSYHTSDNRSEQIDAAIELFGRIFLIEVKWVESNMAASELYAFIGKIENKFHGTLGIFISRVKLSDNFIQSLNKGRRQSVLVVHGEDLDNLFKPDAPTFGEYLTYCFKLLSYDNVTHFPVKSYLPIYQAAPPAAGTKAQPYLEFIKNRLHQVTSESDMLLAIEQLPPSEVDKITDFMVQNYPKIWFSSLKDKKYFIPGNYGQFLEMTKPSVTYLENTAGTFFNKLLKSDPERYCREDFLDLFGPYYIHLDQDERGQFEKWLIDSFAKGFNDWDTENRLTEIIRRIWQQLAPGTRKDLRGYYLEFFLSESRQAKFAQKGYAIELLSSKEISVADIASWLLEKLAQIKRSYSGPMPEEVIGSVAITYHPLKAYIGIPLDEWKDYIRQKLQEIPTNQ